LQYKEEKEEEKGLYHRLTSQYNNNEEWMRSNL
jgi:hypothetical protein